jgi:hypothetical protein
MTESNGDNNRPTYNGRRDAFDEITLRDYIERLLAEHQRAHEITETSLDKAASANTARLNDLFEGVSKRELARTEAHTREHELIALAIDRSDTTLTEWKANANEFRGQLSDQAATFARKDAVDSLLAGVMDKIESQRRELTQANERVDSRLKDLENNQSANAGMSGIVNKLEDRMKAVETVQSEDRGAEATARATWAIVSIVGAVVISSAVSIIGHFIR